MVRCGRLSPAATAARRLHWQLRWAENGPRGSVMLHSIACRSEGSDASQGGEDTVMTDAGGSAPAPAGSASPQLRVLLKKKTVSDLIEECKAAGISGYSNKRKEELIDLLVFKKPRPDAQVHSACIGTPLVCAALRSLSRCFVRPAELRAESVQGHS